VKPFSRIIMSLTKRYYREIGCWPWDVCAGIVIAQEAGGIVSGSHDIFSKTKNTDEFGHVTEELLTGRKYLVVRAITDTAVSLSPVHNERILILGAERKGQGRAEENYERLLRHSH